MRTPCAWLSLPLLLLSLSARAEEPWRPRADTHDPARALRLADGRYDQAPGAFDARDALAATRAWRSLHISKGSGLEYRRHLDLGERELVLGLKGPVMDKKALGLAVEVRF